MAINEERSYTEYNVEVPTTDFPIGFDILDGGIDVVAVTLNDVDPTTLGYTVIQVNSTTYRFAPAVPSGVVRLTRITDIDQMAHVFTEGAIFISENMDGNFKQIRHSQQEVRDSFEKLELEVDAAVVVSNNAAELALEASILANSASGLATQASNDVIDTNTIVLTSGEVNVTLSDGAVVSNMNKRIADYGTKVLSVNGEVGVVVVNAENLTTLNGSTQQEINDRGGATWYAKSGGYALNDRVILDNGDIVKSTVANNIVDPNIDMTGWVSSGNILRVSHISKMLSISNPQGGSLVKVDSYHAPNFGLLMPFSGGGEFIYDSSKSLINDGGLIIDGWVRVWDGTKVRVDWFGADPNGVLDSTEAVLKAQKSLTGRTSSDFQARKPSATIEYGIGIYKQGDIPLLSCVNYVGQGREATQIIPNDTAEWVFKTVGSSEGSTITIPTRMIYNSISEMTIGYGYANSLPISNSSCGGVFAEATSWCRMDNVSLHGLGNTALKLIGVFDADFTDVTIFNTGYAQLAPAMIIDRVTGSNDGSNATTFTRCHFEGNYQHFQIGKNSRHVYFNWLKMETQTISSTITDPQGVFFNDLEISTTSTSHYEIEFAATAGYSPFVVEFNNPVLIGGGNYFYNNSRVKVKINFGSSRGVAKIAKGRNFVISNHYGYDCGANFIDVENSTIKDCEFLDCKTSLITDGTNDSIILSGNLSRMLGTTITGQGSVSDGRAFVNTSNNSNIRLYDNYFGVGSEFAIRGNANANQFDNSAITKMNSSGSTVYKKMLNKGNGLGVGSVNSAEVLSTVDTSVTLTNIIYGSSLIFLRGSSLISALLFADSTGVLTLISKSSTAEVVIGGAGIVGDGKIYISKSGSNLQIMNRSTSQATIYASVISAVA